MATTTEKKELAKTTTDIKQATAAQKKQYNSLVGAIMKEYDKVEASSLKIAFALHEIYQNGFYEYDGFKNIYEFGADRFNLAKGTVNNFINIVEKFALRDANGEIVTGKESGLIPEMEKFSFSKLCLLVSVPSEYWTEFYSAMTAKEIREKKAEIAKRIEAEENGGLLEAEEESADTDVMNPPETDADAETEQAEDAAEDERKHCFLGVMSCTDFSEMATKLSDTAFVKMLSEQLEAFKQKLPSGTVTKVTIGLTYEN